MNQKKTKNSIYYNNIYGQASGMSANVVIQKNGIVRTRKMARWKRKKKG